MGKFSTHDDPGRVPTKSRDRVVQFGTLDDKAKWLDAMASLDSLRAGVSRASERFDLERDPELRTRAIHRFVRDQIHYVADYRVSVGEEGEELADSETILERGYDDCDGKARLFVALVRAIEMHRPLGVEARIRPVFKRHPLRFVHVQAEVRWPGSAALPYAEDARDLDHPKHGDGGWILVELILRGCEMGQSPDECPRGPNGERIIT